MLRSGKLMWAKFFFKKSCHSLSPAAAAAIVLEMDRDSISPQSEEAEAAASAEDIMERIDDTPENDEK